MARENRVRAIDLVPKARRAWIEEDAGFRRLFEVLESSGPAKLIPLRDASEIAMRSQATFKRDFPAVTKLPWSRFHREWRLLEAKRMLESPLVAPQQARSGVGLRSSGKFSAAFRRRFGMTPRQVRPKRRGSDESE